jgi:putative OPT family oligopeptide transporter
MPSTRDTSSSALLVGSAAGASDNDHSDHPTADTATASSSGSEENVHMPYVPTSESVSEITLRAGVLSVVLAVVLGAANVYLGLFAGLTVSASIPAAILSMSILRNCFSDVSILENNLVQTAASAGEALAAGVIFTFPALLILAEEDDDDLKAWSSINYPTIIIISICGGVMGIMFSIPIRRALILETKPPLAFPEGVACANVLKAGEEGGASAGVVMKAAFIGGGLKILQGTNLATEFLGGGFFINDAVIYITGSVSAALFGVGYIIGWKISIVFLMGGVCNFLIALPIGTGTGIIQRDDDSNSPATVSEDAYSNDTRFLGVGAMLVGGLYALVTLRVALVKGVRAGIEAFRQAAAMAGESSIPRTEQDIPLPYCAAICVLCTLPFYVIISLFMDDWFFTIFLSAFVIVFGFFASSIAAYMAGLVGSSNNPISGVTVCVVLITALLLYAYLGASDVAPAAVIYVSAMIACAGSISGDNMQDLKTGHILGATPWKQQLMLMVGVTTSAFVMPVVLDLLNQAYGFGTSDDDDGDSNTLPAPQASLMASVALGVIKGGLPWGWVGAGAAAGIVVIICDNLLQYYKVNFSMPVLAFAVGFYLPMATGVPIFVGSLVGVAAGVDSSNEASKGVLYAGGLITGEALTGILLAIPIVLSGNANILHVFDEGLWYVTLVITPGILYSMYHVSRIEEGDGALSNALHRNSSEEEESDPGDHRDSMILSDRGSLVRSDKSDSNNANTNGRGRGSRGSTGGEQHYFEGLS